MRIARTSNKNARMFVQDRTPFKAHNLEGKWEEREGVRMYVVRSYGWWPLFAFANGQWYENADRYSVSTSKQRSQCHPHEDTTLVPHDSLVAGINFPISQALGVFKVMAAAS